MYAAINYYCWWVGRKWWRGNEGKFVRVRGTARLTCGFGARECKEYQCMRPDATSV